MPPAISIQDVSKQYQLGAREEAGGSFREMLVDLARAPVRRMRRLSGRDRTGQFWALQGVSFDVAPGEVVAVIGRNGAGKSTLLKILSRITEPTSGRIELRGRVASLLEVGTGFHPELTGRENIYLNGAILGMARSEIRRKFDAIVDFAEVAPFLDTAVKHYSSGMYLRLAFSVAAHLDGEILLVDEVLAVGDIAFQRKCLGKMHDVSRGGRTVVFISHNMGAVSNLCSRAIVLDGGRVGYDGTVQEAIRYYLERNLADSSMAWDLDAVPRTADDIGTLARVDRVLAVMSRSEGFRYGEPLRFRIEFRADAAVAHMACAVGLDDIYGSRVVTFESDRQTADITTAAGGRYVADVTIPPFGLLPGHYLLSISLYSGGQYQDYLVHFGSISVAPISEGSERCVEQRPDRGAIHAASTWHIVNAQPTADV